MLTKTNSRLIEIATRITRLDEERKALLGDIKDAYEDAKAEGFTVKALRQAIKIHAMGSDQRAKHDSEQMDLELYLAQIEGKTAE